MVAYADCHALKKKDPAVRIISAPESVTDVNMFYMALCFFIASYPFSLHHQRFGEHGVAVAYPHYVVSSLQSLEANPVVASAQHGVSHRVRAGV